jgi:hypothetical protein
VSDATISISTESELNRCSGKECPNSGSIFMRVPLINKTGVFCEKCAATLKAHGVAEEAKQQLQNKEAQREDGQGK